MSKKAKGHKPNTLISISKIYDAARTLKPKILYTPLIYSSTLSRLFGGRIFLKLENLQKTGSFKVRGATYKLLKNLDHIGSDGVVAAQLEITLKESHWLPVRQECKLLLLCLNGPVLLSRKLPETMVVK